MDGRHLLPDDGSSRRPRRGAQTHRGKESRLLQGVQPLLTRFLEGARGGGGDSNTSTPNRRRRTRVPDRGRPHSGDDNDNHSATSSCGGGFMKRMMRKIHVQRKDNSSKSRYDEEEDDDYEGGGEEDTLDDAPRGDGGDATWWSPDTYGGAGDGSNMVKDANNMGNVQGQPFMRNTPQMPHIMSKQQQQQQQLQQARVSALMHRGHVVSTPMSGGGGGVSGTFLPVLANTAAVNGHGGVASTPMGVPTAGAPPSATAQGPFNRLGTMNTGVSSNGGGGGGGAGSLYNTDRMLSMDGSAPRGGNGGGGGNGDATLATVMNSAGGSSNSSNDSGGGGGLGRSGIMMPSIFGYDRMARGHDAYTSAGDGNGGNAPSRHSTGNDLYNSRYFGGLQQNNSRSSIHSRMSLNRGSNTSMGSIASTGPRMIPYNVQPFRWVPRMVNRIQVMRTYAARQGHTYAAMLQTKVENNINNIGKNIQQQHNNNNYNPQHPPSQQQQPSSAEYRRRGNGDGYAGANGGGDSASDHDLLYTTGSYVSYNSNDIGMDISDTQELMQQQQEQEQQQQMSAAEAAMRQQQLMQLQHAAQQTHDAIALRRQQYQQREQEQQQNQAMQLQNNKYDAYDDAIHAWQDEQRNTVPDDNDNDSNDGGDGGALVKFDATKSVLKCAHDLKLYSFYGPIGTIGVRASRRREAWERSSGNEGLAERIYIVRCNDRANVGPGKTMDSILLLTRMWCDPKLLLDAQMIDSPDVSDDDDAGVGAVNEGDENAGQDGDSEQQQQQQRQRRRKAHNTNDDDDDAHDKKQQQQQQQHPGNGNKVDGDGSHNNNGVTAASPTRLDEAKNATATASPQTTRTAQQQQQGAISTAPSTATTMAAERGVAASMANMMPGAISVYGLLPAHCTSERHLGNNNNNNIVKTTPDSAPTTRVVTSSSCYSEGQTEQSNPSTAHALPRVSMQSSDARSSVVGTAVSSSSPATQTSASPVAPTLSHRTLHDEDKTHRDGDSNTTSVGDSSSSRSNNNSGGGGGSDDGDDGYNSPATSDSDDDDADTARKARSGLLGASTEDGLRHSVMLASSLYLPQSSTTNLTTPNSVVSHTAASVNSTTAAAGAAAAITAKMQRERTSVSSPHKTTKSNTVSPPTLPTAKTAPSANNSKAAMTATTATATTTTTATATDNKTASDNKTATATAKQPHSPTARPQALSAVSETPTIARPTVRNAPRPSKQAVSTANGPHKNNSNNNNNKGGNNSSSHTTATAPTGARAEMDGEYPGVPLI